jgi:predicted nucleic acid-binding protein
MMTAFVLDSSVALAWFMPGEQTAVVEELLAHAETYGAIVPALWRLEVGNILLNACRHKRMTPDQRSEAFLILADLSIVDDEETSGHAWVDTLVLAEKYGLTLYDAAYLELALRLKLPLATLDRDLQRAARKLKLEVWGA